MKKLFATTVAIFLTSSCLSGCAYQQPITAFKAAAAESARTAQDGHMDTLKFELCATPFSAIVRNPEFAGAIEALCLGSSVASPAELLHEVLE